MKIFVTVGTTAFDNLIAAADQQLTNKYTLVSQISDGAYLPKNHEYFRFTDKVNRYFENADLIVCHGGAGTIYKVLELGKKLVIVPNLDRVDHHQLDICDFMVKNDHALACLNTDDLYSCIEKAKLMTYVPYKPDPFKGIAKIRSYLDLN